jgi:lipoprotein signal peptidase
VADSAVVIGMFVFLITMFLQDKNKENVDKRGIEEAG